MDKRYWIKKGVTYRERLRCPLCGKISEIGYFSQDHLFGVYRFGFGGRGKISCELVKKDINFMNVLKKSIVGRLLDLLKKFTGEKYYSQSEVNSLLGVYRVSVPLSVPLVKSSIVPVSAVKSSVFSAVKSSVIKPKEVTIE